MTMTASEVLDALEERYAPPAWAFFREVRNRTGFSQGGRERYADALAFNLYPSRGLEVIGFEVKVSRSDWRRELDDPEKAESILRYCDKWLVAAPTGVVPAGEIPKAWGLIEISGKSNRCRIKVKPEKLKSRPLDRPFVASVCRAAHRSIELAAKASPAEKELAEARKAGYDAGLAVGEENAVRELRALEKLQAVVEAAEKASGVRLREWSDGAEIGAAYALARDLVRAKQSPLLVAIRDAAQRLLEAAPA